VSRARRPHLHFDRGGDVGPEANQQAVESDDLGVSEPGPEALVERHHCCDEALERRLAGLGELDSVHAPVLGITGSRHEPGGLHAIEVVGQRRTLDPDCLGKFPLRAAAFALQRHQDQPYGQRPTCLAQRVVEGSAH
jgi:hypothetical protein